MSSYPVPYTRPVSGRIRLSAVPAYLQRYVQSGELELRKGQIGTIVGMSQANVGFVHKGIKYAVEFDEPIWRYREVVINYPDSASFGKIDTSCYSAGEKRYCAFLLPGNFSLITYTNGNPVMVDDRFTTDPAEITQLAAQGYTGIDHLNGKCLKSPHFRSPITVGMDIYPEKEAKQPEALDPLLLLLLK